jgi:hypothetical protein
MFRKLKFSEFQFMSVEIADETYKTIREWTLNIALLQFKSLLISLDLDNYLCKEEVSTNMFRPVTILRPTAGHSSSIKQQIMTFVNDRKYAMHIQKIKAKEKGGMRWEHKKADFHNMCGHRSKRKMRSRYLEKKAEIVLFR